MEGFVTDPQGATVPNAEVTVTAVDTEVTVNTKTNSAGYYRVVDLVPGKYRALYPRRVHTAGPDCY
jgi:phosphatidate phosphatase APP1